MSYTNEQLIERYTNHLQRSNKSVHTIKSFPDTIKKLSLTCNLQTCTTFDIEDFIDVLISKNLPQTVNQRIAPIRGFFKYLNDTNIRKDNPSLAIQKLSMEEKEKEFILLQEHKYFELYNDNTIDHSVRLAIMISFMGGLRTSEICSLTVDDINFSEGYIRVISGKCNKTRDVAVSDKLLNMISNYMENNKIVKGNLIVNKQYKPMKADNLQKRFATIRKKCGISDEIKIHSGRHANASKLIYSNIPLVIVAQNLGHASSAITEKIYIHRDVQESRKYIKNIW